MKVSAGVKRLVVLFVAVAVGYAASFSWIEHRRTTKGPWVVSFTSVGANQPALVVNQARLGITNVEIAFAGESAPASAEGALTVTFGKARPVPFDVPYGRCVFQDTTFLPGTVTLQVFGHEIELLPRVLVIDQRRRDWPRGERIVLERTAEHRTSNIER